MRLRRILIVEDEEPARRLLRRYLSQLLPEAHIEEATDGAHAMEKLQSHSWDLLLLDIEMPEMDGVSVMHFARSLPLPPAIIFTTAYAEHAVKAFEGGAVDYLLKPFSQERLRQALERVSQRLTSSFSTSGKLPIPRKEGHLIVPYTDIIGIRVEERTIYIETRSGQVYETRAYTLQQLVEKLPSPPFLRIARNALINIDAIKEVLPWFSGRYKVILHTNSVYMCSRELASGLLRAVGIKE